MVSRDPCVQVKVRKLFKEPKMVEVLLNPEEAILGLCRAEDKAGIAQPTCNSPLTCATLGS